MTDRDKMQYIHYMRMIEELDSVETGGVALLLDGEASDAHSIASLCVFCEDREYMRDYRRDKKGEISELSFDRLYR